MRRLLLIPVLIAALGCSSKPGNRETADQIRRGYPVVIPLTLPERAETAQGSADHPRLLLLQRTLEQTGWFEVTPTTEGKKVACTFSLRPGAPASIKPVLGGFSAPVAMGGFVKIVKTEVKGNEARVTYEVRLEQPTVLFPLFQARYPESKLGEVKERHAVFEKGSGGWVLKSTDEKFLKPS